MFGEQEGEIAVKAARNIVEAKVKGDLPPDMDFPEKFNINTGVFVTINRYSSGDLRGCIGYAEAVYPVKDVLKKAALGVTDDPRFPSLDEEELGDIIVEVTLLTLPEEIDYKDPKQLVNKITCGVDGLIVSKGPYKGILLPQVPIKQGWDENEFLSYTCKKADLPPEAWKEGGCTVKKFRGEVFTEEEPYGKIIKKELN